MNNNAASALLRTFIFTGIALVAFAANSVLGRLALGANKIDASSFTAVRLLSGAIVLFVITQFRRNETVSNTRGSWSAGLMLFLYAATFSFAYITLDTATGALILFGAVQITIILLSLISGNRLHLSEWLGVGIAFGGFVYLFLPDISTPSITGFVLMTVAGIAWGIYTIKGRGSQKPLLDTAYNFIRTAPLATLLVIATMRNMHYSTEGILLAMLSGAVASGMGYSIWYAALGGLSATQSAVVQLSVPVIAALGGVIFVSEPITLRLTLAGSMILGGILLVILGRYYFIQKKTVKAG